MIFVVTKDGTGDFTGVQAAIDALPDDGSQAVIRIRPGEYRERVIVYRDRVRIVGEDAQNTAVVFSACARDTYPDGTEKGTFSSFSMIVTGNGVTVENLTVRNDAGDGRVAGQAVAVYAAGDRGVWRNCRLIAHQDTLFCGPVMSSVMEEMSKYPCHAQCVPQVNEPSETRGRQYFENCFIQGDVDFIFGSYRCWFERCTLHMNARGGWYTAANTPENQPYGFVFHRCALTGDCAPGAAYLGRPWRKFARTLFLECRMDTAVSPAGFADWDEIRVVTERCGEYGTRGARADQSARHPAQKRLTEAEARAVTPFAVLGGEDGWRPDAAE